MLPRPFQYLRPDTLEAALGDLARYSDRGMPYAGGTELLLLLKMHLAEYDYLVDLKRIPDLRGIEAGPDHLSIGAMTTHATIARDSDIRREVPALADLCGSIANPRVRSTGTIGGNLCFAEPTADPPTLLAALGATLHLVSARGARQVAADGFVTGPLTTQRADDEVLLRIDIPADRQSARYVRHLNGHRSLIGAAAFLPTGSDAAPRVRLGCLAQRPVSLPQTEAYIAAAGDTLGVETLQRAIADDIDGLEVSDDGEASAAYRRHIASVVTRRAVVEAAEAAGREIAP